MYTGLCFITLAYVWFCVGEVTGRSMEEIEGFFRNSVPARQWSMQPKLGARYAGSFEDMVEEKGEEKSWEDTARA